MTQIAFLLHEDMTALDVVGAEPVAERMADADTRRRTTAHMVPAGYKVEVTR